MEADEFVFQSTEEHIFHSLGFSHPLVVLMPYEPSAPASLLMLQGQVGIACDAQLSHAERLKAALEIRAELEELGLGTQETAKVAIDLLQGVLKLLPSAAVSEQLACAFLDRDGIGLQDRRFSSPPDHPLPTLVRLENDGGKSVPVTHVAQISDALIVWTKVSLELAAKGTHELQAICGKDLRASLRMLMLFLLHGTLDQFRATRSGKLDRLEDMGLSLWDVLLTLLRKCPEHHQDDEERFGPTIQQAMWHFLRSKELSRAVAATPSSTITRPPVGSTGTHLVIAGEIPAGTSEEDRQTLARYERLRRPLPIGRPNRDASSRESAPREDISGAVSSIWNTCRICFIDPSRRSCATQIAPSPLRAAVSQLILGLASASLMSGLRSTLRSKSMKAQKLRT